MEENKHHYPVSLLCSAINTSRAAYYRHITRLHRLNSKRERENRCLEHEVQTAFREHQGRYGRPRIEQVLRHLVFHWGHRIRANRIRKVMHQLGLQAEIRVLWPTRKNAFTAIAEYIERYYNPNRLHSTFGYFSPNEYEFPHSTALAA